MTILSDFSLLHHNTFRINATARYFVEYDTIDELIAFLKSDIGRTTRLYHIGGGSNILFTKNFDGAILHSHIKNIEYSNLNNDEVIAHVSAGVVMDDFCADAATKGLWGIENLSYIPGEAGASAVQNIGAYGVEVCNSIVSVEVIDRTDFSQKTILAADCDYGYRHSRFKTEWANRYIITAVNYHLHRSPRPQLDYAGLSALNAETNTLTPQRIRQFVTDIRRTKLPDPAEIGSAGSFFKNPLITEAQYQSLLATYPTMPHYPASNGMVKIPAAWLIEQCGMKGHILGGAQVYELQPLVIINRSNATASDITVLASHIQTLIATRFSINIYPEVIYL